MIKKNTSQKGIQIQLHISPKVCQQLDPQLRQYLYWYFLVVLMGVWYLWTNWNTQIVTFYSVKYLRHWDSIWSLCSCVRTEYENIQYFWKVKAPTPRVINFIFLKKFPNICIQSLKKYADHKLSHIRPFCVIHGVSLY